ncbi:hypothetical protein A4A49_02945 [Nicotiana attenuata]|uniref:Uncharacterized protein n=1 Tax=Nicotiana attenuata TaxID=49451 RepID=A0A314L316_NICAT|nr:hypothetical protein A4A49_02945 [Nicotiana attenuata]
MDVIETFRSGPKMAESRLRLAAVVVTGVDSRRSFYDTAAALFFFSFTTKTSCISPQNRETRSLNFFQNAAEKQPQNPWCELHFSSSLSCIRVTRFNA